MSAGMKKALPWIVVAIAVFGVCAYNLWLKRGSSTDSPPPPAGETTYVTLKGSVPINVNVPVPKYRITMEVPDGAAAPAPAEKSAPRPAAPTPATPPTPPAPKKADVTKVLVLNGLTSSVEIKYRTEASPAELGTEGGASRTLKPGEEALIDGVAIGEVLTARVMDPAGEISGTYHCRVVPGPGPVRMWHILEYARLRK